MNRSSNYQFYLPQNTDPISVSDFNYNFQLIDDNLITKTQSFTSTQKSTARGNLDLDDASMCSVANNLTTTASGSVLDARQGKILFDQVTSHGTWQVITETKTTGVTGNIALDAVANGKQFIIAPHVVGGDVFLRSWRASGNEAWYLTATNPNTGATINNTELSIRYIKITLP